MEVLEDVDELLNRFCVQSCTHVCISAVFYIKKLIHFVFQIEMESNMYHL